MRENVFSKSVRNSHWHFVTRFTYAPHACVLVGAWTLGGALDRFILAAGLK